jgi:hypothetical protein
VPSFRTHLQHVCGVRARLRAVAPAVAATLDAAWPSAALGALAADARYLTGEPRQATHGYDHRDPDSMRAGARAWLARRPDAAALLRRSDAPTGHVAFVLGYVCHVALDAWWGLGRLGLLGPDGAPALPRGVDLLPFDPADRVAPDAIATALLPDGFPHDAIRLIGEIVREMGTCDQDELLRLRLELPLCRLSPAQRDITLRLHEEQANAPRVPESETRARFEYAVAAGMAEVLAARGPAATPSSPAPIIGAAAKGSPARSSSR